MKKTKSSKKIVLKIAMSMTLAHGLDATLTRKTLMTQTQVLEHEIELLRSLKVKILTRCGTIMGLLLIFKYIFMVFALQHHSHGHVCSRSRCGSPAQTFMSFSPLTSSIKLLREHSRTTLWCGLRST